MKLSYWSMALVLASGVLACSHKPAKEPAEPAQVSAAVAPAASGEADPIGSDPRGSDGQNIEGLQTVHFAFDKSTLSQDERDVLRKDAKWIQSHPAVKMQIEGHCDNRGSIEYNFALGEKRAQHVIQYLSDLGIPKEKLTFISYGKEKPIDAGDSEEAFAKNRRANFVPIK